MAADGRSAPVGKVFPGCGLWNPAGERVARYDKCHLFDVNVADGVGRYRESDHFAAGNQPVVASTPWGPVGLSICYDLRFPEYYRQLVQLGAILLTVPSAFTYRTGEAHWEVLLRARAIENQCFVAGVNRVGVDGKGHNYSGDSMVIDPLGEILYSKTGEEDVNTIMLEKDRVEVVRKSLPFWKDRDNFLIN